jgi:hypothetical protein
MPFFFNPCLPCCTQASDVYLGYVPYGSGHIILAGTPYVLTSSYGPTAIGTPKFWKNVESIIGFGAIATTQTYTPSIFHSRPLWTMLCAWPTVWGVQTADQLEGIGMLYTGFIPDDHGGSYYFNLPPESMWSDVAAWVASGGVLVVIGQCILRAFQFDLDRLNAFLRAIGVAARFTTQNVWPYQGPPLPNVPDGNYTMSGLLQNHFLTDGACGVVWGSCSLGFGLPQFSTDPTATITNATPLAKVGTVIGWENTCDGVYVHGCDETPVPKTLYSSGFRSEQLPLTFGGGVWQGIHGVDLGATDDWQVLYPPVVTQDDRFGLWAWAQNIGGQQGWSLDPAGPPPNNQNQFVLPPSSCPPLDLVFKAYFRPFFNPPYSKDIEITP